MILSKNIRKWNTLCGRADSLGCKLWVTNCDYQPFQVNFRADDREQSVNFNTLVEVEYFLKGLSITLDTVEV